MFAGGKTPLLPVSKLEAFGYHAVIIPSDTQRAAIKAMQRVLAAIARDGSAAAMAADMVSFKDREALIDTRRLSRARQALRELRRTNIDKGRPLVIIAPRVAWNATAVKEIWSALNWVHHGSGR